MVNFDKTRQMGQSETLALAYGGFNYQVPAIIPSKKVEWPLLDEFAPASAAEAKAERGDEIWFDDKGHPHRNDNRELTYLDRKALNPLD